MKRNALVVTLVILVTAAWALWPHVALQHLKRKALDNLTEGGKHSFPAREIREMTFDSVEILNHFTFEFEKSVFDIPQPQTSKVEKTEAYFEYEDFKISIVEMEDDEVFKSLPLEWGKDDFAKMIFIDRVSDDLIRDAKTPDGLKTAVTLVTAKIMMFPMASGGQTIRLDGDGYRGLLQGGFSENPLMVCHLKSNSGDRFLAVIAKTGKTTPEDVHQFFSEIRVRENLELAP
ncbi:MAG: hypothetical protein ABF334_00975 [Akkermansiaceae bacterium]